MTARPPTPGRSPARRPSRGGFTLVEMVVVIGIIILLIGILLPSINRAYNVSTRTAMWSDLGAIQTALTEYRNRHGDYPRVEATNTGFAVLCKALVGPAPANASSPAFGTYNSSKPATNRPGDYTASQIYMPDGNGGTTAVAFNVFDGADGPGYRVRSDGPVQQPLLPPEKFQISGCALLDRGGMPILYYPGNVGVNINAPGFYAKAFDYAGTGVKPMYNANDNVGILSEKKLQLMIGDNLSNGSTLTSGKAQNGSIDVGEVPAASGPYLLISAGPDRKYGPEVDNLPIGPSNRCDDVGTLKLNF